MQFKITYKFKTALQFVCLLGLLFFTFGKTMAQGTITTTNTPGSGIIGGNVGITFDLQNTNATARVLSTVNVYWDPANSGAPTARLWVTTTSLSGPGSVTSPNWTAITGFVSIKVTTAGIIPTFTGLNYTLAANTQYRFAVESTDGIKYGAATTTPNTYSTDGVALQVGNFQVAGSNVGYALNPAPTLANNPRFFTGSVSFVAAIPCAGTPTGGNSVSSVTGSCAGVGFNVSTSTILPTGTTGVSYQLQSSPTLAGTYANVGASSQISTFYNLTQTAATAYRIIATCANGGGTVTFAPIFVPISTVCYCAASGLDSYGGTTGITNVTLNSINRNSLATAPYENHLNDTTALIKGGTYPFSITPATAYTDTRIHIWIDYNGNGDFLDPGEDVYISPAPNASAIFTGNITIPATATTGFTRMRIRYDIYDTPAPNNTACGTSDYGQVEDYTINIVPCVPVTITTQPTAQTAACQGTATFTAAVNANGTFPVYQWQFRTSSTGVYQNVPNSAPYSGTNTNTLTVNPVTTAMNGYEYRISVSGTCTASNPSNSASLTVTPLIASLTPASATICLGSIQQLTINNIDAPLPFTNTVTSGSISLLIPDAAPDQTGVKTTLNISGIPAGAVITGMKVNLNMTHTYSSDIIFVLKAPNNNIFNLDYAISGTATPGANMVNTTISSGGTALLSSGAAPWTGVFKADARLIGTASTGNSPAGPIGFIPTVSAFSGLYSVPNGVYTLAMYDYGAGDEGTLTSWSITIDYLLGTPTKGVFTGPSGTLFTDATATTPYTGTPINSIYVKPTIAGINNYKVVVSNAICTSDTLTIPVMVNTPAAGTPTLSNTSVCVGSNTFLKLGGTLTGGPGFVHTFQVKAPGATSFTNITVGGVYSVNNDSLKLSAVPLSFNGYQFRDSISTGANCGSVISSVATLSVNPIPVVTISVAPRRNLFPGLTTTLTAAVSSATGPITYQWFRNNVPVTAATNNTLVVGINGVGTYTVRATAQGCSSADSTTTPQSIKIGDSTGVTKLFIYPSPNNGVFQVRYFSDINDGSKSPAMVNVYDQKGARVFTKSYGLSSGYQQMNVDLGSHSSGIYRVELSDLNGDRIKTGTVIVF